MAAMSSGDIPSPASDCNGIVPKSKSPPGPLGAIADVLGCVSPPAMPTKLGDADPKPTLVSASPANIFLIP